MSPTHFNLTEHIRFYIVHSEKFLCFRPRTHQHRRYCNETEEEEQIIVKSFSFVVNFQRFAKKEKAMEFKTPKCNMGLIYDEILQVCTINWLRPSTEAGPERYYAISWLKKLIKWKLFLKQSYNKLTLHIFNFFLKT